jgi:hypothetical protein
MSATARQAPQSGASLPRLDELYTSEKPPIPQDAVDPENSSAQLVLYRDVVQELLRPQPSIWLRVGLTAPWIVAILVWFFAVKSVSQQQAANLAQDQSLAALAGSISHQNEQVGSLTGSLQTLASAVASSSIRANGIEAGLERSRRDLRRIESKLYNDEMQFKADASATEAKPPQNLAALAAKRSSHHHEIASELQPLAGTVVARDSNSKATYWLVPRESLGVLHMITALPIAAHPLGVVVHDVEDGKDYVVTQSGVWLRADDAGTSASQ